MDAGEEKAYGDRIQTAVMMKYNRGRRISSARCGYVYIYIYTHNFFIVVF